MNDRDIMQQALDALEIAEVDGNCCYEATELLRTRLAQPEQVPVAIPDDVLKIAKAMQKDGYHGPLSWAQLERLVELVTKKTVEAERQAFIEKIQAEIDHAAINDTRLAPSFGKREGALAVRIGALEAALDAIRARGQA